MKSQRALLLIGLFAATLLLACRFTGGQAVAQPTEQPTLQSAPQPGNFQRSLKFGGLERRYNLHLPPRYDNETLLPLVIVLHGGGGNGNQVVNQTGMNALADEMNFVVAYPFGTGRTDLILTWNTGHCCGYALNQNTDDVGFLSTLIDMLLDDYALDPERVFVTGLSNGGMMAYRLAAELSDKIAAFAPVSGAIGGYAKTGAPLYVIPQPSEPVPVIIFHGQQDQHVLYLGGHGEKTSGTRVDLSVAEAVAFWVEANGCSPEPQTEVSENGNIIIDSYSGCDQDADVVLVTIVDGGHAWPGADPGRTGADIPTKEISANEMMLEFFLAHPKQ